MDLCCVRAGTWPAGYGTLNCSTCLRLQSVPAWAERSPCEWRPLYGVQVRAVGAVVARVCRVRGTGAGVELLEHVEHLREEDEVVRSWWELRLITSKWAAAGLLLLRWRQ